jgi:hypothetical protein
MITAGQVWAAPALLRLYQHDLAELFGLSLPMIQRMEGSDDVIRYDVDSLMKFVSTLSSAGIEMIGSGVGGRGVRLAPRPHAL